MLDEFKDLRLSRKLLVIFFLLQIFFYWGGVFLLAKLLQDFGMFSQGTMRFAVLSLPLVQSTIVASLLCWSGSHSSTSTIIPVLAMYGLVIMLVLNPGSTGYFYGFFLPEAYFILLSIFVIKTEQ